MLKKENHIQFIFCGKFSKLVTLQKKTLNEQHLNKFVKPYLKCYFVKINTKI